MSQFAISSMPRSISRKGQGYPAFFSAQCGKRNLATPCGHRGQSAEESDVQDGIRKMLRYERAEVRKFHHVIAVSENDRALMMKWIDGDRITVVPTGVDLAQYRPDPAPSPGGLAALIIFVGAMDWEPNVDALEFFCGDVWPAIKAEVPDARFRIVGRNPDRRVQKWAASDASIEVTGRCLGGGAFA